MTEADEKKLAEIRATALTGPWNVPGDALFLLRLLDERTDEVRVLRADFNDCNAERARWKAAALKETTP